MAKTLTDGKIQVESGDTLSGIYGSNWKTLSGYTGDPTKLQIGTILPALQSSASAASVAPPATINEANSSINSGQEQDFKTATVTDEPEVRSSVLTYNDIFKQVSDSLKTGLGDKPETVDLTNTYKTLRSEQGVTDLEEMRSDLLAQARDLQAISSARTTAEKGKAVPMNVIAGRISEEEAQDNERLAAINSSLQTVNDQLTTKYNMIDTIMKYTGEDYTNSVNNYNNALSQNLTIMNNVKGIVDSQKTEEEAIIDNARANAQILVNSYTSAGTTWENITTTEQNNLIKLGVQSGLGANFFSNVLAVSAGKDILTTLVSQDQTSVVIMYKDGTTKKLSTGLSKDSSLTASEQKSEEVELNRQQVMSDVGSIIGEDGKVDPNKMYALRKDIALYNPELLTWFDTAYKPSDLLNPDNYTRGVRENSWTAAIAEDKSNK